MSLYSLHMSNVSRGGGSNACATLSYITGSKVKCEWLNKTFNYGRSERVIHSETLLPPNAPAEFKDASTLFNAIENYETASNARTAKKIMVALPREFDRETQEEVMRELCANLTTNGYACTFAIHCDEEGNNPHAHVLVANRPINAQGDFEKAKCRKDYVYKLDANGNKIPELDPETGKQKFDRRGRAQWMKEPIIDPKTGQQKRDKNGRLKWQRVSLQENYLSKQSTLENLRVNWENICNKRLEPENHITAKSHKARGLHIKPTIHDGWQAENKEINAQIKADNMQILNYDVELDEVRHDLLDLFQQEEPAHKPQPPTPATPAVRKAFLERSNARNQRELYLKNHPQPAKQQEKTPTNTKDYQKTAVKTQSRTPQNIPQQQQGLNTRAAQAQRVSERQEKQPYTGKTREER